VQQLLAEQVAIITGGARGIGLGIGSALAEAGARVVLADLDEAAATSAAATLREGGHAAEGIGADVTDRASIESLAAHVTATHGRIDILAANAGIYPSTEFAAIDDALWDRVMDINVKGAVHAAQACLPAMLGRGYGRIVLTSSITGPITGQIGFTHYGASKAAMLGLMRSLAVEVATHGVTVNAVMPGNVETPGLGDTSEEHRNRMLSAIPMGRFGTPRDIGVAVRFFASPEAGYITGQTLIVDGGQVLPEGVGS
jgi:3-oxoacyl-[acyl-carrier protein] reductase